MTNLPQRSFLAGELAPSLWARTDLARYAAGLRTCRNFLVQRHGGVANRPGTEFVSYFRDSTKAGRFVKFVFSSAEQEDTYLLEFGDRSLRIYQDGGYLQFTSAPISWLASTHYRVGDIVAGSNGSYYANLEHTSTATGATDAPATGTAWTTYWLQIAPVADSQLELPTPWLSAELPALQVAQSADVMTLVHPSYPPYELQRFDHQRWRLAPIDHAPDISPPTVSTPTGGAAGGPNYWTVTAVKEGDNEESVPATVVSALIVGSTATPVTVTWTRVAAAIAYRIYRSTDGVTFGLIGQVGGGITALNTDTTWADANDSIATTTKNAWVTSAGAAENAVIAGGLNKPVGGVFTVKGRITVSAASGSPTWTAGHVHAYYSRDGEPIQDAGVLGFQQDVYGAASTGAVPFEANVYVPDNGYATLTLYLRPAVYGTGTGTPTFTTTIDFTAAPSNAVVWSTIPLTFSDTGQAADLTIQPPTHPNLFDAPNRYPSVTGYYQQRRLYAASNDEPEKVWASVTANYDSFAKSTPIQDDDALSFRLAGLQVHTVRHLRDLGALLILTSGGVHVAEGDEAGILRPDAINLRRVPTSAGAHRVPPVEASEGLLYVQARGTALRELVHTGPVTFTSRDLTLMAAHLFNGKTIVDLDYAEMPHAVVWAVRSDGVLLGLTYLPEEDIVAWHRHDTDGFIENVCTVPEGDEDAVYLGVRRTLNGATVRCIERMASRTAFVGTNDIRDAHFVDCGLVYDGRNTADTVTITPTGGATPGAAITLTASSDATLVGVVGDTLIVYGTAGQRIPVTITVEIALPPGAGSAAQGTADLVLPTDMAGVATSDWAWAASTVTGLTHLNGEAVSVLADGYVLASPDNPSYPTMTPSGGSLALGAPYGVVRIGLPYRSDIETLDIDTPSGPSLKDKHMNVNKVIALVEASRGFWAGGAPPTDDDDDPIEGLYEQSMREESDEYGVTQLKTKAFRLAIESGWNDHGRVFVRQIDPLPLTISALVPSGLIPSGG